MMNEDKFGRHCHGIIYGLFAEVAWWISVKPQPPQSVTSLRCDYKLLKSEALAVLPTDNTALVLSATAVNTAPSGGSGEKHMNV